MKNNTTLIWVFILTVFVFMVGFAGGIFADRVAFANVWPIPVTSQAGAQPDFRILREAWKTIEQNYVDRPAIQPKKLEYGAVSGMVEALGDTGHSRFLSPEMVKVERNMTQGWFEGIGAEVQEKDGQIVIVSPDRWFSCPKGRPQSRRCHSQGKRQRRDRAAAQRCGIPNRRTSRYAGDA